MKPIILLPAITALAACVETGGMTDAERDSKWGPPVAAYILCNRENAVTVARQKGDPLSLAVAVTGMCAAEKNRMWSAFAGTNNSAFASEMTQNLEKDQIQDNAAIIVKARR